MPLGKYDCEDCDKHFQDTPYARKRHLNTSEPELNDPSHAYAQSLSRGVCNRFVNTDACKSFHPKVNQQNTITQGASGVTDFSQSSTFQGNQIVTDSSVPEVVVKDNMGMSWGNVPPSLMPPPESGYPQLLMWTGVETSMSFSDQ